MEPGEADGWRGGENCGEGRFYLEWEAGVVGLEVWEEVGEEWRGVRIGIRDVARSFRQRSWGSLMLNSFLLHVDRQTLLEPARLALVPPRHVHDTSPILLAHVVKVTSSQAANAPLEKSSTSVAGGNSVMFPASLVPTHLAQDVTLPLKRQHLYILAI